MLRLPSNQKEYDTYWSGDPAFHQPAADASEEDRAEHAAKVKRAQETGDWSPLLIEGETPTKFVMRPIDGNQWRWLVDESSRDDQFKMGAAIFWSLMFRCAIVRVVNLGMKVSDTPVKHAKLGMIAPQDIPNLLDTIDASIVTELAGAAFERARNLNPL